MCSASAQPTDPPRVQVLDGGQVQPTLAGRDVRDVRHPRRIGSGGLELTVAKVICHRKVVVGVRGGAAKRPRGFRGDAGLTPQLGDGVDAAVVAAGHQFGVDARAAVAGLDLGVDCPDLHKQGIASLLSGAARGSLPGVVASGGDLQRRAEPTHGPAVLVLVD
jgi:hypothetical protein